MPVLQLNSGMLGLVLLLTFAPAGRAAEGDGAPPRVAVLSDESGGTTADALQRELSTSRDVVTVDRGALSALASEQGLSALLAEQAERTRVGRLLSAEVLLIVRNGDDQTQVVIADTRLGATLGSLSFATASLREPDAAAYEAAAREALDVINRFRRGVTYVVAVPDFVSRDLTFERNYLQSDFAEVIRNAYRQLPGVALVAVDEAQAIAAERQLGDGEQGKRVVPLFIEGEYRHTREESGTHTVRFTIRATDGTKQVFEQTSDPLQAANAGKFLLDTFARELLPQTDLPAAAGTDITPQRQFELLIARADVFAQAGEFRRSALLREAGLLLNPDSLAQRKQLIREYTRRNSRPYEAGEAPPKPGSEAYAQFLANFITDWTRSLHHCEYLIRNRLVSREEASGLAADAVTSVRGIQVADRRELAGCETLKKQFLREAFARIATLEPYSEFKKRFPEEPRVTGVDVYHAIIDLSLWRCDRTHRAKEDLDLLEDLLLNRLADSMWPTYPFNFFLRETAVSLRRPRDEPSKFSTEEYLAFLERLAKSDRPLVRIYGRYGRFCYQRYTNGEASSELLAEARSIVSDAEKVGFDLREHDYYMGLMRDEVFWLNAELERREAAEVPPGPPPPPVARADEEEVEPAEEPAAPSRVRFEPIPLALESPRRKETSLTSKVTWRAPGGWGNANWYRPLGKGLDAFWARGALLFIDKPGVAREVLADEKINISDVVSDGQYVWVATSYDKGVYVLDRSGKVVTRVGKAHGLPPTDDLGALMHPLEPGRVMITGSFGNTHRGWIATIDIDPDAAAAPKIDVFHEGTRTLAPGQPYDGPGYDPHFCFQPNAVFEHPGAGASPEAPRLVYVVTGDALVVDVATKKVTAYGAGEPKAQFPRALGPREAFASIDGVLYVAGTSADFNAYRLNPRTNGFDAVRDRPDWDVGGLTNGSLARDGDWLYYAGASKWRRINLKTHEEQSLIDDSRQLPNPGSGDVWGLSVSDHFGLVAWTGSELYRVTVAEPARP